jgi:hypothetical protein
LTTFSEESPADSFEFFRKITASVKNLGRGDLKFLERYLCLLSRLRSSNVGIWKAVIS